MIMFDYALTLLSEMFSYTFLVRAFVVGVLVSLCASLLGVSLVLKRYSMIGDGLSHVGFGALALATALNAAPLMVSLPIVLAAAFFLLHLGKKTLIKGDAAIALISTSSLAIGVVIISMTTGMNTDVCNYLFGSILAMNRNDVYLSIALSITVLVLFVLFYHKLFAITFDEAFAQTAGVKTGLYNMLIAFLTAITIVLGMRLMGAMLISALIIFPALSSMRIFKRFKTVTMSAVCVSAICFFTGIVISYIYAIPTGASIVLINIFVFLLFWAISRLRGKFHTGNPAFGLARLLVAFVLLVSMGSCGKGKTSPLPASTITNNAGTSSIAVTAGSKTANTAKASSKGGIVEIKEKMFIAQTNDVYLNTDEYLGRTIKLEGLFKYEQYAGIDTAYCFVLRYGPGCCGNDGNAGFEVAWDHDAPPPYPEVDAWVEAVGTLSTYEEDGYPYVYISLSSLKVLDKRGAEYVTQ
jgi:zinc transport system permease protein